MENDKGHIENVAAEAFTRQSGIFDDIYGSNTIIKYKRERIRAHINKYLQPSGNILELNAGTGEDAIYFAEQGHTVHATDISSGMLGKLKGKVNIMELVNKITTEQCSFNVLDKLKHRGPYDLIFSNFAGLNCTWQLPEVIRSFEPLLKDGGIATLVLLSPFCLWESLQLLRGQGKLATRRFSARKGVPAHVEGVHFTCWYYSASVLQDSVKDIFEVIDTEGLCTLVPPSYFEHFAEKHPRTYAWLKQKEESLKNKDPWRSIGDYYIITFRKK
ncbi:MAG: class I SAM-dependent methyltransferase [Taibaiella sp.]|nr:class I SAM-dependent methyltransferase [Taibaiella sp.]